MKISEYLNRCRDGFIEVDKTNYICAFELLRIEMHIYALSLFSKRDLNQLKEFFEVFRDLNKDFVPVFMYYQRMLDVLASNHSKSIDDSKRDFVFALLKLHALRKYSSEKEFDDVQEFSNPLFEYLEDEDTTVEAILDEIDKKQSKLVSLSLDDYDLYPFSYNAGLLVINPEKTGSYFKLLHKNIKNREERIDLENEFLLKMLSEKLNEISSVFKDGMPYFRYLKFDRSVIVKIRLKPKENPKVKFEQIKARILAMDIPGLELSCDVYWREYYILNVSVKFKNDRLDSYRFPLDYKYLDSLVG